MTMMREESAQKIFLSFIRVKFKYLVWKKKMEKTFKTANFNGLVIFFFCQLTV